MEPTEKDLELMKELAAGATSPEKGDKKDDDDDADVSISHCVFV